MFIYDNGFLALNMTDRSLICGVGSKLLTQHNLGKEIRVQNSAAWSEYCLNVPLKGSKSPHYENRLDLILFRRVGC